jgi:diaminohydroxyphosphoribosylaminopyrimidine deaminase/5-amino-6-(5-phosphoribosylamino)uracil reductase
MRRCIEISNNGSGFVAPNPKVGCLIVHEDRIIGEGWHRNYGGPHAEVNALKAMNHEFLPEGSTVYVSLEPCAHQGKTPPCADLLIAMKARTIVIGARDPFKAVNGKGITKLKNAGVDVTFGVLEDAVRMNDPSFFTSIEKGRPFITLKWAQSKDGFIAPKADSVRSSFRISCGETDVLTHRWRSEHMGILVGSGTALSDNPKLNVRLVKGRNPVRILLDRKGVAPPDSHLFDGSTETWVFGSVNLPTVRSFPVSEDPVPSIVETCHNEGIRSLLVEGGAKLHEYFIRSGLWDEARVIVGPSTLDQGLLAPEIDHAIHSEESSGKDIIRYYHND